MAAKHATMKGSSENDIGRRWDSCVADSVVKVAAGLGLGVVFSLVLFKGRPWPVAFGTGIALGNAYSNCKYNFRNRDKLDPKLLQDPWSKNENKKF